MRSDVQADAPACPPDAPVSEIDELLPYAMAAE
jgi:hypothetical protein